MSASARVPHHLSAPLAYGVGVCWLDAHGWGHVQTPQDIRYVFERLGSERRDLAQRFREHVRNTGLSLSAEQWQTLNQFCDAEH